MVPLCLPHPSVMSWSQVLLLCCLFPVLCVQFAFLSPSSCFLFYFVVFLSLVLCVQLYFLVSFCDCVRLFCCLFPNYSSVCLSLCSPRFLSDCCCLCSCVSLLCSLCSYSSYIPQLGFKSIVHLPCFGGCLMFSHNKGSAFCYIRLPASDCSVWVLSSTRPAVTHRDSNSRHYKLNLIFDFTETFARILKS